MKKMGTWVVGWFAAPDPGAPVLSGPQLTQALSTLLVFYEYSHSNPNFASSLGVSPSSSLPVDPASYPTDMKALWTRFLSESSSPPPSSSPSPLPSASSPSTEQGGGGNNILRDFLSFCAFVLRDCSPDQSVPLQQVLCLLSLIGLSERDSVEHTLHSSNFDPFGGEVVAAAVPEFKNFGGRALVGGILSVVVDSLRIHTKREFDPMFFRRCLCVVHRVICYQHANVVRLNYKWKKLWDVLIRTLSVISALPDPSSRLILEVSLQVTTIFNLFITYGDQFANAADYDELYYEIIRNKDVVEHFCNVMSGHQQESDLGRQLTQQIENFRTILVHFSTKLDYWSSTHGHSALSPEEVMGVIRTNYASLKLNLVENLAVIFPYAENPQETAFFTKVLRQLSASGRLFVTIPSIQFEFERPKNQ